jgi:hypothetical protein
MHAVQQPLHASSWNDVMGVSGLEVEPVVVLVADGDQAIPPDAERQFAARMSADTVEVEVTSNHVAMVPRLERITTYATAVAGQSQL